MNSIYNVWLVNFELNQMAGYLKFLSSSIEDYQEKLETIELPTEEEILVSDASNDIFNAWTDEVLSISEGGDYWRRLYSAFLISWYAFVEDNLVRLCTDLGLSESFRNVTTKKSTKGIWLAHDLIEGSTPYRCDTGLWQELRLINKIRNLLVHNGGKFEYSLVKIEGNKRFVLEEQNGQIYYIYTDRNLYNYTLEHNLLCFYGTFFVKPTPEFCEHLVAFAFAFFDSLFRGLDLT